MGVGVDGLVAGFGDIPGVGDVDAGLGVITGVGAGLGGITGSGVVVPLGRGVDTPLDGLPLPIDKGGIGGTGDAPPTQAGPDMRVWLVEMPFSRL
jgi:hypothetical protein